MKTNGPAHQVVIFLALTSLVHAAAEMAQAASPKTGTMVWLSDIHFDPFYPMKGASSAPEEVVDLLLALSKPAGNDRVWRSHQQWGGDFPEEDRREVCLPAAVGRFQHGRD